MLEINVKTIDGQNRSYSVPEDYTVRQFKEKITSSLNIPVDRQRLIFQGRELKDNNSLNEFGVNGKTLHLVQRTPPSADTPVSNTSSSSTTTSSSSGSGSEGIFGNQDVAGLVQQLIGGLGGGQSTVTTSENGMEVHIDMNNISHQANDNEIRSRIRNIRRFLTLAQSRLNRLQEIQSGAPLEDTAGSILIGSIHGTAQLSDANGTLGTFGFDIPNLNYGNLNLQNLLAAATGGQTVQTPTAPTATAEATNSPPTSNNSNNEEHPPQQQHVPESGSAETATEAPPATATTPTPERSQDTQNINVEVLGDVIQSVMTSYATFLPYLQQYHEMLVNDENEPPESPTTPSTSAAPGQTTSTSTTPNLNVINSNNSNIIVLGGGDNNRRQRFCNNINDMMHLLGHLFHNLSDLHINIRDRPPRQIHTMNSMQHTASAIISARPIEANIHLPTFRPPAPGAAPPRRFTTRSSPMPQWNPSYQIPINRPVLRPPQQRPAAAPGTPSSAPTSNSVHMTAHQAAHEAAVAAARATGNLHAGMSNLFNVRGPGNRGPASGASNLFMSGGSQATAPVTSYDPFLPCNSVHFYNTVQPSAATGTSQRRRHPAGDQTGSTTTSTTAATAARPTTMTASGGTGSSTNSPNLVNSQGQATNVPLQNQGDIGRLISNVLSQIGGSGGVNQQVQVNIGGMPGQISIGTLSTSNVSPSSQLGASMFNIEQLLGGLGAGIRVQQHQQQPATGAAQDPASATINSLIREAISLMDSDNTNDQRLNQPLTGLLNMSFGEDDEDTEGWRADSNVPPTSTLSIFNVLFSSMTLGDMINLARGTSRDSVFERSRQPLRDHIKRYFLSPESTTDQALNEENTRALVDRVYSEMFIDANGLSINLNQFEVTDPNIDFPKSFEKLMKEHLRRMLVHVYDTRWDEVVPPTTASTTPGENQPQQQETWSSLLFKKFHEMIERLVVLARFSIRNADVQFTQVVTQKLRQAVVSQTMVNNPMFFNIFDNFIQTQVQQTLTGIRSASSSDSEVKEYVVYKVQPTLVVDDKAATTSSELNNVEEEEVFDDASSSLSSMDIDSSFNDYKKAHPEVVTSKPKEEEKIVVTKTTSWRDTLPKEWMEDINRDIQTQANSAPRPPFSDAYCSGMPAKRRKVFTLRSDLQDKQIFKKVLGRTLEKIQLKQNASVDSLVEESLINSQLIDSFSAEFNTSVTERLRNDEDFNEILKKQESEDNKDLKNKDRFSNSRKRFK